MHFTYCYNVVLIMDLYQNIKKKNEALFCCSTVFTAFIVYPKLILLKLMPGDLAGSLYTVTVLLKDLYKK